MSHFGRIVGRALMIAVPIALGITAVMTSGMLKTSPAPSALARQPALVRTLTVEPIEVIARVSGYGAVKPARDWRAVARIEGEVTEVAETMAPGDIMQAGTVLFRIDDSDLRLALAVLDAQAATSKVKDETLQASLELARADLSLAADDLARQDTLKKQGVATQAALDASRRQALTARTKVTDLDNQLALNKAEANVLATQRASLERSLDFVALEAPFDMRVTSVDADQGQYVSKGQVLLTGEGTDAAEIDARFPLGRIGPLLRLASDSASQASGQGAVVTDLSAVVRLPGADHTVMWPATIDRMGEAIDDTTQNAPLFLRVDDPLSKTQPGARPPLRRNMIVEVELSAPKQTAIVVPAEAIRNSSALVVSAEDTLEKRAVQLAFVSGEIAIVSDGLQAGDRLVITDPSIAVLGMTVKAVEDAERKAQITALALGTVMQPKSGSGAGKGEGKQP